MNQQQKTIHQAKASSKMMSNNIDHELPKEKTTERRTMICMRQNIQELNRSMESIEKMIERSRKILNHSKEKNKLQNNETYRTNTENYEKYEKLINNNFYNQPNTAPINQKQEEEFSFETKAEEFLAVNKENNSSKDQKNKVNSVYRLKIPESYKEMQATKPKGYTASPRNNELKLKNTLTKEVEQKRISSSSKEKGFELTKIASGGRQDNKFSHLNRSKEKKRSQVSKLSKTQIFKQEYSTYKSKQKFKEQLKEAYSPFLEKQENGKKIYKFSPQKTSTQKKVPMIKLDIKGLNNVTPKKKSIEKSNNENRGQHDRTVKNKEILIVPNCDNIKIQEEEQENLFFYNRNEQYLNNNGYSNQMVNSNVKDNPYVKESNEKEIRYKTQYKEDDQSNITYKLQSPKTKPALKKINLKRPNKSDNNNNMLISQRQQKTLQESIKLSARVSLIKDKDNKQKEMSTLVKELDELQTISANEADRKRNFMMKIKKYGFVQKYLSEQQIWSIYHQMIDANINELKWPIFIVDQVYRRMKIPHAT